MQGFKYQLYWAPQTIPTKQQALQFCQTNIAEKQPKNIFIKLDTDQKIIIKIPVVCLLLIYWHQQKQGNTNVELQIQFEDTARKQKLRSYNIQDIQNIQNKQHQKQQQQKQQVQIKHKKCIYRVLQLQTTQSYNTHISVSLSIKYGSHKQYQQYHTLQQLVDSLSRRQFGAYNDQVHKHIRFSLYIQQPLIIKYRYNNNNGYLLLQISSSLQQHTIIKINKIQIINWLIPQHEKLRTFKSQTLYPYTINQQTPIQIYGSGQMVSIMFTLPRGLAHVEIPYCLEYCMPGFYGSVYRIIKMISIQ